MEKQKSIPQLRFPEFEGEWDEYHFGRLFSFKTTNSFSREQLTYDSGEVKNIHYGDIHTKFQTLFDIKNELAPYINSNISLHKISEDNYCQEGDVIFADASEDLNDVGKSIEVINLDSQKVLSGLHTILARPKRNAFQVGFAGYLMKSSYVRTQIQKESQGTKVLSISSNRLSKISILYPTLPEQQKIASFFTAIDQKISQLKRKKTLLEQYKKGVMQKIFSQQIRFKDDNGQEFPKWEKKRLGEISEVKRGAASNHLKYVNDESKGIRLLRINDFLSDDAVYVEDTDDIKRFRVRRNDLLIAGTGATAGIVFIVPEKFDGLSYSYNAPRIRVTNAFHTFIYHYLKSDIILKQQKKLFVGNAQTFLDTDVIRGFKINLPSNKEQTKIANFLSAIDDKIIHTQKQIEKSEVWKKGLMQQMFC